MVSTRLAADALHPDTQVALLLCASFALEQREPRPLTVREYNALVEWLTPQGRGPGDLLQSSDPGFPTEEVDFPSIERIQALLERGLLLATCLERWQSLGLWVISREEPAYPERLRNQLGSSAPVLLYGVGKQALLNQGGLAIVGSRDTDEEGISFTQRIAGRCAEAGLPVISGGARGIDQAAIAASLDAGGKALVVLADRLDRAATNKEAKGRIREGNLTILSPYEPEQGFTIGRAMGRNKLIYALADQALVVRFIPGEGGTWTGAVERLRHNKKAATPIPVLVRSSGNPEEGTRELLAQGAVLFPEKDLWQGDVRDTLTGVALAIAQQSSDLPKSAAVVPPEAVDQGKTAEDPEPPIIPSAVIPAAALPEPSRNVADSCYQRCLPLLLQQLRSEPGEKDLPAIARQLEIMGKQLKEWLKRAQTEGKVQKKKKGRRQVYVDATLEGEAPLFQRGGDAA